MIYCKLIDNDTTWYIELYTYHNIEMLNEMCCKILKIIYQMTGKGSSCHVWMDKQDEYRNEVNCNMIVCDTHMTMFYLIRHEMFCICL